MKTRSHHTVGLRRYSLKPDVIINGLPLIDTSKTIIEQYCPYWLKKPKCEIKRYREYNGLCANPENPHWGATRSTFKKLIAPAYPDGEVKEEAGEPLMETNDTMG